MAVDGSRETTLVQTSNEDHSPMWTPDGRGIVFKSDRSGTSALWHVRGFGMALPRASRNCCGPISVT